METAVGDSIGDSGTVLLSPSGSQREAKSHPIRYLSGGSRLRKTRKPMQTARKLQIVCDCDMLHRPDLLFDPEEVAEAFDRLEKSGKVRCFG